MAWKFTTDSFLVQTNYERENGLSGTVSAKYLKDNTGNYVINPSSPIGEPYIAPFNYNPNLTVQKYSSIYNSALNLQNLDNLDTTSFIMYGALIKGFYAKYPGNPDDLQRNYNGIAATNGGFVKDFTPIASFNLGLAVAASNLTYAEALVGGALQNIKSHFNQLITLDFSNFDSTLNSPANTPNIYAGFDFLSSSSNSPIININDVAKYKIPFSGSDELIFNGKILPITYYNNQNLTPIEKAIIINLNSGETLIKVSQEYQISLDLIKKYNPQIADFNHVAAGAEIYLPIHIATPTILHGFNDSVAVEMITDGILKGQLADINYIGFSTGFSRSQLQAANPLVDLDNLTPNQLINLPTLANGLTNQFNSLVMSGNNFSVVSTVSAYDATTQTFGVVASQAVTATATGSTLNKYDATGNLTYQGTLDQSGNLTNLVERDIANNITTTTSYNADHTVSGYVVDTHDINGNPYVVSTDALGNIISTVTTFVTHTATGDVIKTVTATPNIGSTEVTQAPDC